MRRLSARVYNFVITVRRKDIHVYIYIYIDLFQINTSTYIFIEKLEPFSTKLIFTIYPLKWMLPKHFEFSNVH